MPLPILIVAPESIAVPLSAALRKELDAIVESLSNRRAGLAALRRGEYSLILLDEAIAAGDTATTDLLYQNAGAAPILEINFNIAGSSRILRQVRSALTRRAHDLARARTFAATNLQCELNSTLTGLLLESQLALRNASPETAPKLRHLVELAGDLRNRLRIHA